MHQNCGVGNHFVDMKSNCSRCGHTISRDDDNYPTMAIPWNDCPVECMDQFIKEDAAEKERG